MTFPMTDFILFSLFMISLGVFSFGGIVVCSLVCEKHRVARTEDLTHPAN